MVEFVAVEKRGMRPLAFNAKSLIVAGWTGRDAEAVEHHVRELEAIGVRRPATVPTYYRVAAENLTCAPRIQVAGRQSTGEVEVERISENQRFTTKLLSERSQSPAPVLVEKQRVGSTTPH